MPATRRLLALVPNLPGVAPGQRARIESWSRYLEPLGWSTQLVPFEDEHLHDLLYEQGRAPDKAQALAACWMRSLRGVLDLPPHDVLLVYREAALVGPAVFERLARRSGAPMVFDLDDPTFVPYRSPTSGWFSILKFPGKTRSLFRMADHVITINGLMADEARRYNPAVTVIPNTIDVDRHQPVESPDGEFRLLWTGSSTTAANLETIIPALRRLQDERGTPLRVVCDGPVRLDGIHVEHRPFDPGAPHAGFEGCHVGLVPVNDLAWNRWKFFHKAVQYFAAGLPVVARRIGSNPEVITEGVEGFLVETQDEWYRRLVQLADDAGLRKRMSVAAREKALASYSMPAQVPRLAALLDKVQRRPRQAWRSDQS